ncbi:MAG: hypothetical protein H7X99_02760 [Saprospiraceae bacterium]|nr:hypothetical protein [Saprospiraceae bacterium]
MKNYKLILIHALVVFSCIQCKPDHQKSTGTLNLENLKWLQGTWITVDSSSIETWAFQNKEWIGNVYSPGDGKITENLRIFNEKDVILYEATVKTQNEGKPIRFTLEGMSTDSIQFVNMDHDYPNHIDYFKMSDSTLFCNVYGHKDEGKGFVMKKLKER